MVHTIHEDKIPEENRRCWMLHNVVGIYLLGLGLGLDVVYKVKVVA